MTVLKPRVLLVENDFTVAQNLYSYLKIKGFVPDAAYDGHAALGLLESGEFDAVVLDIGLPGLDGYAVLRAIRKGRSEEHTSELQSLMRLSYAVFCLKKKN